MLKKLIFFISLFFISNITIFLSAEIIPLKKPLQTKEEKDQKLLIDIVKPLPKPVTKKAVEENKKEPNEEIKLKEPNEVSIEIYRAAREKAKKARKMAVETYLEAMNIKNTYMLDDIDSSDDEFNLDELTH